MEQDYLTTLVLVVVCGYLAHRLIRWLWPIYEQRKSLTSLQMLERAAKAPLEAQQREQQRQMTKYGTYKRTMTIHFVNMALLLAWMHYGATSPLILWGLFVYQVVGFLVLRQVGVPIASALAGLNANDRFWLRMFYAWQWPLYVPYLFSRK